MTTVERDGALIEVPAAWQPPTFGSILPELIEQGRKAVAESLKPAGDEGVAAVMMPVMLTTLVPATEGMSDTTLQGFYAAKAGEYQRHLREVPLDILKAAADACVRESEFFPAVAALLRHAKVELEKRRRQAERIKALIDARNRPQAKPAFEQEPEHVRLLTVLKWQEKPGSHLYSPTKAHATRARLLELGIKAPGEPPPLPEVMPAVDTKPTLGTLPRDGRAWTAASDAAPKWTAGQPIYAPEEPPPPDAVAEASDFEGQEQEP